MLFISKIAEYFNTLSKEWGAILAAPPAKVDEIEKAKILKKAIKDGTVELEELPWEISGKRAKPKRLKARTTKADPSDNPKKTWKAPKPKAKIVKVKSPK
jgi:hypothetical protein